jgi:chromate transporter
MVLHNCADKGMKVSVSVKAVILTIGLFGIKYGYQSIKKKKMSPIVLILISGVAGIIVYGI